MRTKSHLKSGVKLTIVIVALVLVAIVLNKIIDNDMEKHIERVSQECAEKGYGIKAKYTKEGDKYYVCNK